jgi:4-amino-4-deoxy-L-arabinose transferase-like glycosyltransferase
LSEASARGRLSSFRARLLFIATAALGLRVAYTLALAPDELVFGDRFFYHEVAGFLADGRGYVDPFIVAGGGPDRPTAGHPPLYPLVLSLVSLLGGDYEAHRLSGCVFGAGTVAVIGLLGRRVAGDRAGLAAAVLAAVYPTFVAADGSLMSESLYGLFVASALLAALALISQPSTARALALGAAVGLAALSRSEGLLLLPLLAVPIVRRAGWRPLVLACLACALALAPWAARNWVVFDRPVLLSNNDGTVLAGANCAKAYSGREIGLWLQECVAPARTDNEAEYSAALRRDGLGYARDHASRLPVVVGVRVLRTWDLYQPWRVAALHEGRHAGVQRAGRVVFYLLVPLAVYGALLLRRRGVPRYVLLAPLLLVTITSVLGFGTARFRHAAEIPIVTLAAVAVTAGRARAD